MDFWTEYFTWEFEREPEGYFSWQHLLTVSLALLITVLTALWLGRKNRNKSFAEKMKTVKTAALLIDGFELLKLTILVIITKDFATLRSYLPLFLCSIPLIVLPVAAFSKGRLQQAALDFMLMFGLICGVAGTFLAGNIYSIFPVLHFEPLVSLTTHNLSAFACLYIGFSGLATLEKKNTWIAIAILGVFMTIAETVNLFHRGIGFQDNYMFLSRGDGTPFQILENIFGPNTVLYALSVALLMWGYMLLFILVARRIKKKRTTVTA
jgi:predicted outer membrane lipoprotein